MGLNSIYLHLISETTELKQARHTKPMPTHVAHSRQHPAPHASLFLPLHRQQERPHARLAPFLGSLPTQPNSVRRHLSASADTATNQYRRRPRLRNNFDVKHTCTHKDTQTHTHKKKKTSAHANHSRRARSDRAKHTPPLTLDCPANSDTKN